MTRKETETGSRTGSKKEVLTGILSKRDHMKLKNWAVAERNPLRILTSMLFEEDSLMVWRAIEAIGKTAPIVADRDIEKIRRQIQRYLWMMNDESGALCWYGPEAIAEILVNVSPLQEDFTRILPSFLIEEPFEAGTRWGMTRLVKNLKLPVDLQEHYRSFEKTIRESLRSKDVQIRGNSIRLLKALDFDLDDKEREEVSSDVTEFELYEFDSGSLEKKRICDLI